MKNLFLIIFTVFFFQHIEAQNKTYRAYLEVSDIGVVSDFKKNNDSLYTYEGTNKKILELTERSIIKNINIAFPAIQDNQSTYLSRVIEMSSNNMELFEQLVEECDVFLSFEDITNFKPRPLYTPNDFNNLNVTMGNQNPFMAASPPGRKDLEYIGAEEAWDLTSGIVEVKIGISDTRINPNLIDFRHKTTTTPNQSTSMINSHGINVAAIAAAHGDNNYASLGICYDCGIVGGWLNNYNQLLLLAQSGVAVINMSWTGSGYINDLNINYVQIHQDMINYIVDTYNVTFVAASGNRTSFSSPSSFIPSANGTTPSTPFGVLYSYPASYDNVISVGGVGHNFTSYNVSDPGYCCTVSSVEIYRNMEDSASTAGTDGTDPNNPVALTHSGSFQGSTNPNGLMQGSTLNERVDIIAPWFGVFQYSHFPNYPGVPNDSFRPYGVGTSYSAPLVSGTIGLMKSIDNCLTPAENEDILLLTAKDVEHTSLHLNTPFFGKIGYGVLKANKATDFVYEMNDPSGVAVIKDHKFYRGDFYLNRFQNELSLDNVEMTEDNNSVFVAKNAITIKNTVMRPNQNGLIHFLINSDISTANCSQVTSISAYNHHKNLSTESSNLDIIQLYPSPTSDRFNIESSVNVNSVEIYSLDGILLFNRNIESLKVVNSIDVSNYNQGLYIVRIKLDDDRVIAKKLLIK